MAKLNVYQKKKIREQQKRYREKCKREHRCVACGKSDERTLSGRIRCEVCAEKQRQSNKKWYRTEHGREVSRQKKKKLSYKRINRGVCIQCGKNPPKETSMYCEECTRKSNERARRNRQRKAMKNDT